MTSSVTSTVRSGSQMQWPTHKPYVWVIASWHHPIAYGKSYKSTCEITINESFHKLTEILFLFEKNALEIFDDSKKYPNSIQIVCLENRSVGFRTRDSQSKYKFENSWFLDWESLVWNIFGYFMSHPSFMLVPNRLQFRILKNF